MAGDEAYPPAVSLLRRYTGIGNLSSPSGDWLRP